MDIEKVFGAVLDQELRTVLESVLSERYAGLRRKQETGQDQRIIWPDSRKDGAEALFQQS